MRLTAYFSLLLAACLLGEPAFAETEPETLRQLFAREHIDFQAARGEDLETPVTSGDTLDTADIRIVATYVTTGHVLDDCFYVFLKTKARGSWRTAEVCWPKESSTACRGGSIVGIRAVKGFLYLDGHITPSASCTMVLTDKLAFQDTFSGWPVAQFQDGRVVYQHSEPHFAPTHYTELSIYDPVSRRSRQIYPPSPATPLRRQYIEKTRGAYERCCVEHPPADCGGYFAIRNHHCDPERFENSIDKVTVDDAGDSITFKARFDDIAGPAEVIYSISHLREGTPEVRETPAGEPPPPTPEPPCPSTASRSRPSGASRS